MATRYARQLEREQKQAYLAKRQQEVDAKNKALDSYREGLESILQVGLQHRLRQDAVLSWIIGPAPLPNIPVAAPIPPDRSAYEARLPQPGLLEKLLGIGHSKRLKASQSILDEYNRRVADFEEKRRQYNEALKKVRDAQAAWTAARDQFIQQVIDKDADAVVQYFRTVLASSPYPSVFAADRVRASFNPQNGELIVEREFPTYEAIIPTIKSYKYVKARDEITEVAFTQTERKQLDKLYNSVIAAITLRTLHEIFTNDFADVVQQVVFNGMVSTIDKSTGKDIRPCLVSLHTSREDFTSIELSRVEPDSCLRHLKAQTSPSYRELVPVKPVVDLVTTDPRFIDEVDVVSQLDTRPNLLDMDPFDFEQLICNLFTRIGLKTSTTRASRDGGVDVVAFDTRPVFGGKIIIQAKRYRNTVEVSAIRDLFGAVHNEGAIKGILVTTSSFGTESHNFAKGKPLELIDGNRLLYLLAENGIQAKIEIPKF